MYNTVFEISDQGWWYIRKSIQVMFWGVRGSLPVPHADMIGVGGNTSCTELCLPSGEIILIDCGTGVRSAGRSIQSRFAKQPGKIHIFFSHFHWDHVQGLPFFEPLYQRESEVIFYSHLPVQQMAKILESQMKDPYFPTNLTDVPARISFTQTEGKQFTFGETQITSFPLNHPQGASGYRVEHHGHSLVFASDHEHGVLACDTALLKAAQGADILIYDAQFTPSEYSGRHGWGHSTWLEGTRVAERAGVKRLILFHHDPRRTDRDVERIIMKARKFFPRTTAAREGLRLKL